MSVDDTRVLIGGRKFRKIPPQSKLFMENEDPQGSVRQRYVYTSTPHHHPPPPYHSPKYLTPPPPPSSKSQPSQLSHHDSGFYGSFDTPDKSLNSNPSLNSTIPNMSNLWDSMTSPLSSIKNRITGGGRPNFLDDDRSRRWKLQPQLILGCLLFVTIFSSLGFSVLISVKHFGVGEEDSSAPVNGKYQSMKFASEKINDVKNAAMKSQELTDSLPEASPIKMVSDPIFDVMDEIGQLSDSELEEKLRTEELGAKIKASGIEIQNVEMMSAESNEIPPIDSISEELLTTRPLVVEHPAPTQAPPERSGLKGEASKSKSKPTNNASENDVNIKDIVGDKNESEDVLGEPECCPHKPIESKSVEPSSPDPVDVPTKSSSKLNKKSKAVNPSKVEESSKPKLVEEVPTPQLDVGSLDYPDLPTFRGMLEEGVESEEAGQKDVDYPDDPSAFR